MTGGATTTTTHTLVGLLLWFPFGGVGRWISCRQLTDRNRLAIKGKWFMPFALRDDYVQLLRIERDCTSRDRRIERQQEESTQTRPAHKRSPSFLFLKANCDEETRHLRLAYYSFRISITIILCECEMCGM